MPSFRIFSSFLSYFWFPKARRLHARLLGGLTLNLELEVKVGRVEVVHTHVTVLTTGAVALSSGVDGDVVERAEVTTHTADLLLEDLVVEAGLELTLAGGCGGDVHGGLTTTEDNVVLRVGGDGGGVEGCVGDVGLEDFHRVGVVQLGGLVFAGGQEVGAVGAPLQVGNLEVGVVREDIGEHLAGLCVPLGDAAVLVAGNDVLGEVGESSDGDTRKFVDNDAKSGLIGLLAVGALVDVVNNDVAELAGTLLGHAQQLLSVLRELDTLDRGQEVPCLEQFSSLHFPKSHGVVGAAGREQAGVRVDIDGPEGTLVALVCAETLAICAVPRADGVILRDGEDKVALLGEPVRDVLVGVVQCGRWRGRRCGRM
jgi:hypothetical protein